MGQLGYTLDNDVWDSPNRRLVPRKRIVRSDHQFAEVRKSSEYSQQAEGDEMLVVELDTRPPASRGPDVLICM
ncbi:hypothetical protein CC2G_009698 [Coprinopsis cinerea AmutBmut pab1-1]|nr:hypothetical protein CC2G_009698 [Coprinopsis cinerea AmutBmut pab1-1]